MVKEKTIKEKGADTTVPKQTVITMYRGGATFLIGLHFDYKGQETLEDKIKKLIRKDVQNDEF